MSDGETTGERLVRLSIQLSRILRSCSRSLCAPEEIAQTLDALLHQLRRSTLLTVEHIFGVFPTSSGNNSSSDAFVCSVWLIRCTVTFLHPFDNPQEMELRLQSTWCRELNFPVVGSLWLAVLSALPVAVKCVALHVSTGPHMVFLVKSCISKVVLLLLGAVSCIQRESQRSPLSSTSPVEERLEVTAPLVLAVAACVCIRQVQHMLGNILRNQMSPVSRVVSDAAIAVSTALSNLAAVVESTPGMLGTEIHCLLSRMMESSSTCDCSMNEFGGEVIGSAAAASLAALQHCRLWSQFLPSVQVDEGPLPWFGCGHDRRMLQHILRYGTADPRARLSCDGDSRTAGVSFPFQRELTTAFILRSESDVLHRTIDRQLVPMSRQRMYENLQLSRCKALICRTLAVRLQANFLDALATTAVDDDDFELLRSCLKWATARSEDGFLGEPSHQASSRAKLCCAFASIVSRIKLSVAHGGQEPAGQSHPELRLMEHLLRAGLEFLASTHHSSCECCVPPQRGAELVVWVIEVLGDEGRAPGFRPLLLSFLATVEPSGSVWKHFLGRRAHRQCLERFIDGVCRSSSATAFSRNVLLGDASSTPADTAALATTSFVCALLRKMFPHHPPLVQALLRRVEKATLCTAAAAESRALPPLQQPQPWCNGATCNHATPSPSSAAAVEPRCKSPATLFYQATLLWVAEVVSFTSTNPASSSVCVDGVPSRPSVAAPLATAPIKISPSAVASKNASKEHIATLAAAVRCACLLREALNGAAVEHPTFAGVARVILGVVTNTLAGATSRTVLNDLDEQALRLAPDLVRQLSDRLSKTAWCVTGDFAAPLASPRGSPASSVMASSKAPVAQRGLPLPTNSSTALFAAALSESPSCARNTWLLQCFLGDYLGAAAPRSSVAIYTAAAIGARPGSEWERLLPAICAASLLREALSEMKCRHVVTGHCLRELVSAAVASMGTWSPAVAASPPSPHAQHIPQQPTQASSSMQSIAATLLNNLDVRSHVTVQLLQLDDTVPLLDPVAVSAHAQLKFRVTQWICVDPDNHLLPILDVAVASAARHSRHNLSLPPTVRQATACALPFASPLSRDFANFVETRNPLETIMTIKLTFEDIRWRVLNGAVPATAEMSAQLLPCWKLVTTAARRLLSLMWGNSCTTGTECSSPTGSGNVRSFRPDNVPWEAPSLRQFACGESRTSCLDSLAQAIGSLRVVGDAQADALLMLHVHQWWDIDDLVTARWVFHRVIRLLTLHAGKNCLKGITRARSCFLMLVKRFGASIICHVKKADSAAILGVPRCAWLPILEQWMSIMGELSTVVEVAGAEDAAARCPERELHGDALLDVMTQVLLRTAMDYPGLCIWPILYETQRLASQPSHRGSPALAPILHGVLAKLSIAAAHIKADVDAAHSLRNLFLAISRNPLEQLSFALRSLQQALVASPLSSQRRSEFSAIQAALRQLRQFSDRPPKNDQEKFVRVEILAHVVQLEQYLSSLVAPLSLHPGQPPQPRDPPRWSEILTHPTLVACRDRVVALLRNQLQTSIASICGEDALHTIHHQLQLSRVILVNMRECVALRPMEWRLARESLAALDVEPVLSVFPSAQRPKRVTFLTGRHSEVAPEKLHFLVKGNEDLTQDMRMQRLLQVVSITTELCIRTYSVIPITPTCGIVEMVIRGETMGRLVQQYRGLSGMPLNREVTLLADAVERQQYHEYDTLPLDEKRILFAKLVPRRSGANPPLGAACPPQQPLRPLHTELYGMLLHLVQTQRNYLIRRRQFSESLANMSVMGHLIGLGDRHPSNLLIDKQTLEITHVDFEDIFCRAMLRPKFPERVPFRATRMLERCLDLHGFDSLQGQFLHQCARFAKTFAAVASAPESALTTSYLMLELLVDFIAPAPGSPACGHPGGDGHTSNRGAVFGVADRIAMYQGCSTARNVYEKMVRFLSKSPPRRRSGFCREGGGCATAKAVVIQRWFRRRKQQSQRVTAQEATASVGSDHSGRFLSVDSEGSKSNDGSAPATTSISAYRPVAKPSRMERQLSDVVSSDGDRLHQVLAALIQGATVEESLCQQFSGWMPFW